MTVAAVHGPTVVLSAIVALVAAACGAPSIGTRLRGTLDLTGSTTYQGGVVFEIPSNLGTALVIPALT